MESDTITHRGTIHVNSANNGQFMSYISTVSPGCFSFRTDSSNALNVNFETGTGTNLNINIEVRLVLA